jgi:hypothetical protein
MIEMVNELQASPQGLKFNYKPIESKYIITNMQINYQTSQDSNMLPYLHYVHGWIYNKNVKCQNHLASKVLNMISSCEYCLRNCLGTLWVAIVWW